MLDRPIQVLLIEDNPTDAMLVRQTLAQSTSASFAVSHAERLSDGLARIEAYPVDVVLLDLSLPDSRGLETICTAHGRAPAIPIVVLTHHNDETLAVTALQQGAQDYLIKSRIEDELLVRALRYAIERKHAEEAREKLAKDMELLLESTGEGIYGVDLEGRCTFINRAAARMCGYEPEEVLGRSPRELFHPGRPYGSADPAEASPIESDLGAGQTRLREDEFFSRRDGTSFPVEYRSHPIVEAGRRKGAVMTVRDITARKQAERRRNLQYAVARALAESATVNEAAHKVLQFICETLDWDAGTLWSVDPVVDVLRPVAFHQAPSMGDSEFQAVSRGSTFSRGVELPGCVWVTGSPAWVPDFAGDPSFDRAPLAAREGLHSALALPFRLRDEIEGVMEFFSREIRQPDEDLVQLLSAAGSQIGIFIERKRAEEAARQGQGVLRSFYDSAPMMMGIVELRGEDILHVSDNEAAVRFFRCGPEAMRHRLASEFGMPREHLEEWIARYRESRQTHQPVRFEYLHRLPETPRWISATVCHIGTTPEGNARFSYVAEDVTERRSLENQLHWSQKMEAVGRLAGGVAHDFNNLLVVITGYGEIVLRDLPEGHRHRTMIREIGKAAERAAALTRQLLAFSRKQVVQPRTIDLNAVVEGMDNMLRRLIGEDVELRTTPSPELGTVLADPGQMEQVLVNLVVNARDAMPGGGRLTIETRNVDLDASFARQRVVEVTPGRYVMLAVSDTGVGMDAETLSHMFEPFFTTKEQGKGTGLGLATVYGIVKGSAGSIWAYSEPGQGTTLKVYLPRVDGDPEPPPEAIAARPCGGTETILLVEDEEAVRGLVREVLEESGYTVLAADGHAECLRIAAEHRGPIHLLVTDVVMPGMGGRALAERLTASRPGVKVLFTSGYSEEAIAHHGVLEPGTEFLEKPFSPDALARKVRGMLDA